MDMNIHHSVCRISFLSGGGRKKEDIWNGVILHQRSSLQKLVCPILSVAFPKLRLQYHQDPLEYGQRRPDRC